MTTPPHLAAAGNARPALLKMVAAVGVAMALVIALLAYSVLADDDPSSRPAASGDGALDSSEDATAATASLWVVGPASGAYVLVDGDSAGAAPLWMDDIAAGEHTVRVLMPGGGVAIDTTVWAEGGEIVDIDAVWAGQVSRTSAYGGVAATAPDAPAASRSPSVASTGDLRVTSTPAGSAVTLDGRRVGVTPLSIGGLASGTHSLAVVRQGFETTARRVEVRPGGLSEVVVNLLPIASRSSAEPPPAATGTIEVLVRPWGSIAIDGTTHQQETDVVYRTVLTAGPHRVRVSHPQLGSIEREVIVRPGERERAEFDLTEGGG